MENTVNSVDGNGFQMTLNYPISCLVSTVTRDILLFLIKLDYLWEMHNKDIFTQNSPLFPPVTACLIEKHFTWHLFNTSLPSTGGDHRPLLQCVHLLPPIDVFVSKSWHFSTFSASGMASGHHLTWNWRHDLNWEKEKSLWLMLQTG